MAKKQVYDFSGWATKYDLKCKDDRIIRHDAFKDNDGMTVPLVWQHLHNEPDNILGYAVLEHRDEGVYMYGMFNDTPNGERSKKLVRHGDITRLSIYANDLVEKSKNVLHGAIREVSLALAGANPGAVITNLSIAHADGEETPLEDEAIITTGEKIELPELEPVKHTEETDPKKETKVLTHASVPADPTVQDIFDTFTEEQKNVVYALVAEAMDQVTSGSDQMAQSQDDEGDDKVMKHNVFDGTNDETEQVFLTHDQFNVIVADAKKSGSLKESFLRHADEYGITNIDYLFPDAQTVSNNPAMIQRKMAWVAPVINGTFHTPFARIKSLAADITPDAARAKGYVKGNKKKDEVIALLRRTTDPTTIYKKQKLDRDDIVDITDLDVVAWLKAEMRVMLDEELARAILIGDGRQSDDEDKINESKIRPIYKDDDMYVERVRATAAQDAADMIELIIKARKNYSGSGNPTMFVNSDVLSDMLLLKDTTGRRLYDTQAALETVLRVSSIVEVPVMSNVSRTTEDEVPVDLNLIAIVVNLKDYTVGADKGGSVGMFDDFDIDYNQYKYLMETRCSGALVMPKSAIVLEQVAEEVG